VTPTSATPPPADPSTGSDSGSNNSSGSDNSDNSGNTGSNSSTDVPPITNDAGSNDPSTSGGTQQSQPNKPSTPIVGVPFPAVPAKPVVPAPTAPKGLRAKAVTSTRVDLTWTDTSTNETGVFVERSFDGVHWSQVGVAKADTVKFSNLSLSPGLRMYYRVRAYNAGGLSAYSSVVMVTTPLPPTVQYSPSVVTAVPGGAVATPRPPKAR
jgi:hypothetical protein